MSKLKESQQHVLTAKEGKSILRPIKIGPQKQQSEGSNEPYLLEAVGTASRALHLVLGSTVLEKVLINQSKVSRGPLRWLGAGAELA